jgi:hypothetical protein
MVNAFALIFSAALTGLSDLTSFAVIQKIQAAGLA